LPEEAYAAETSKAVYGDLAEGVRAVLDAGHAAIADAVFARPEERAAIAGMAGPVPFDAVWLTADLAVLRARVGGRTADASDADARIVDVQAGFDALAKSALVKVSVTITSTVSLPALSINSE